MKKYYTQLFLILIFSGIVDTVFAETLIRQDGVLNIPSTPVAVSADALARAESATSPDFEAIAKENRVSAPGSIAATSLLAAPNPPTGLTATGIDISTIRLSWSHDMVNVEKFVIERKGLFTFQHLAEVPATTTSYDDEGLVLLVNYSYRVKAVMGEEHSDYSNEASGTTAIIPTVPTAPSNLTASTVTSGSVELKWVDNSDNENGFVIEKAATMTNGFTPLEETLGPNTTTATDTDVNPNTSYLYRVKAVNEQGSSDATPPLEVTTLDIAPAAPSGLTATPLSSTSVSLQWMDNSDNETAFILERSSTETGPFDPISLAAGLQEYTDVSLTANTTYYYRIKAINVTGDSDYSGTVNATTLDVAPAAPTELQVTGKTASTITLDWTDNSDNETAFVLERSETSASDGFEEIEETATNAVTFTDAKLASNTTYYYRIKARNAIGDSDYATTSGKTDDMAPAAPSGLQVSDKSASSITLSWTDMSTNETGFVVERSEASASSGFTEIEETAANVSTFEDIGLKSNTTYYYRVKATNAVGDSDYTSTSGKTNDVAPEAPSGLQITYKDANKITLKWTDNSDNEANFVLEKSTTSASSGFSLVSNLPPNTSTYDETGLTSNTTYYYRISAVNAIGGSGYSSTSGTTDVDLPLNPSGLTIISTTTSSVELSWRDNSNNESGFILERSLQSDEGFSEIEELPANDTTYLDEGLASNTTYFYRVMSFNKDGNSLTYSNTVGVTTERESGPPAAPSLLKATGITTFQINLSWQDNADNETSYIVERSNSESGPFAVVTNNLPANTEFYENTGLRPGETYYYRVRAKNIDGDPVSNIASATTMANPQPPAPPTGLSAMAVSTVQINLTWVDNSNSETNFAIQRAESLDGTYQLVANVGANVTSYQNYGLTPDKTYYYRVRAESGDGVSKFTSPDNAKTFQLPQPPTPPSSLVAKGVSTTQINLTWIDNSNSETAFVIERSAAEDGTFNFVAAVGANVTSYSNTGLTLNTRYYYKVRAVNSDGPSGYSNTTFGTTLDVGELPIPPTNLVANGVSTAQINLTWQDNSENETNFQIHRSTSAEGPFAFLVNVPANQEFYENTGLQANTTYYYKIMSSNSEGNSLFSNTAQGSTSEQPQAPAAPDGLTALAVSTTQITLRWNDKAFNETLYEIEMSTDGNNFTAVGTVSANDTLFQNFGLTKNTEYFYRVRAQNKDGVSAFSNVASAVTLENKVPPIAPSNLFVKPLSQSELELSWIDNSDNEEEFNVERAELETETQTTANFVIVRELPSNTNYFVDDGLKPNTIYRYRIQAANSDGNAYSNEFTIITSVGGNPVIITLENNYPRFFSNQDEDTLVSIMLAEPELYESVLFYYRGLTGRNFKTDIPVEVNENVYSVRISKDNLDEMGVEYYFEAKNSEGNPAVSAKGFTYWKMENPGLTLPDLKFGESVNDYQMISMPLALDQNRIVDVLEDDLGAYDPSQWRLFHYEKGAMLERGAFIDITPGQSYWLIMKQKDTINTGAGNVVEAHNGAPFKLQLNEGWNQIGNPYMFEISWNEVLQANGTPGFIGPLVTYNKTYVETPRLGVFEGAYVHSGKDTTIVLPIGIQAGSAEGRFSTAASAKLLTEKQEENGWNLGFSLSASDLVYNLAGLGMHNQASESKDRFDRIALPKLPAYLDINFEHPEYFSPQFTKDIVPLQESYIWDMQVVSSLGSRPVTISWKSADQIPEGMNLVLFDPVRQKKVDMKLNDSYKVAGEAELQVFYGNDEFIAENLQPESVFIGDAYPNPFVDALTVPLSLPVEKGLYTVEVYLYNNVGKQVGSMQHFAVEGGFQDIQLSGTGLQSLNDGLYFFKVRVSHKDNVLKEKVGRVLKR